MLHEEQDEEDGAILYPDSEYEISDADDLEQGAATCNISSSKRGAATDAHLRYREALAGLSPYTGTFFCSPPRV